MDRKAVAKQIREAIFDQAEIDGRVMHASSMDEIIEKVLALHDSPAPVRPSWMTMGASDLKGLAPGSIHKVHVGMDYGSLDYTPIAQKDFYLTNAD